MIPAILILILVALIGINVQFKEQLRLMKATKNDIYEILISIDHSLKQLLIIPNFSKEDNSVKAMTEIVKEAESKLPSPKEK